jgi:hypothetical protein
MTAIDATPAPGLLSAGYVCQRNKRLAAESADGDRGLIERIITCAGSSRDRFSRRPVRFKTSSSRSRPNRHDRGP